MGYRARLGKVSKQMKRRVSGMTGAQVDMFCEENEECTAPYRPYFHEELFGLGKYFDKPSELSEFYDFDVYKEFESEFSILTKDGLRLVIEMYHDNIAMMYEEALESKEKACLHIAEKVRMWGKCSYSRYPLLPYFLDEKRTDGEIANSWRYEYSIYNLIYIYRTFDWDKDYLIYSAW